MKSDDKTALVEMAMPAVPLEACLQALCRFGKPRVCLLDGGWYASVGMNTTAKGTTFEVSSDFKHETAAQAVRQCAARVRDAVTPYLEQ